MKSLLTGMAMIAALAMALPASAQRFGPEAGAQTGTGPDVVPPGGYGPSESALYNAPPGTFYPYPPGSAAGGTTWSTTPPSANTTDPAFSPQSR